MITIRRSLRVYAGLMLLPLMVTAFLMGFVPTPYSIPHDQKPDCTAGTPGTGGIRLDCDNDAPAVEWFEYALILYVGVVTAGFIASCAALKSGIWRYIAFMAAFVGFGMSVVYYQSIAAVPIVAVTLGPGDHDESWFTAFIETWAPMMIYTLAWVALATMVGILRRRKR